VLAVRGQVEDGKPGELWVSSRSVAHGYWNKPEVSEETFRAVLKVSWNIQCRLAS
jgi:acyl-CoA synthetase (AMP-forming)/AMP-acid ligase II